MSKKYFYSIGQQIAGCGRSTLFLPHYKQMPQWVKDWITQGFIDQMPKPGVERRKSELAALSMNNNEAKS